MSQEEQEKRIQEYLDAMVEAFRDKAQGVHDAAGTPVQKFEAVTQIRDALRSMPKTLSIASGDYDHCPSGVCNGGVCTRVLSFGSTTQLRELGVELGVDPVFFEPA